MNESQNEECFCGINVQMNEWMNRWVKDSY